MERDSVHRVILFKCVISQEEAHAEHQITEILQEHSDMRHFGFKIAGFLEYLNTFSFLFDLFLKSLKAQNQFFP